MAKIPVAANQDRACQRLIEAVYEAAAEWRGVRSITVRRNEKPRYYLGMSEIGKPCDRALWFGFRGCTPNPIEGRVKMLFELGDHIEQIQIFWLEAAGYKITNRQDNYSLLGGYFRGHPDGTIHGVTSQPHSWDAKSCNKKKMDALRKSGLRQVYPAYYSQAQMMMHCGGNERALYTFYCKDNSEWYAERLYYNRFDAEALISRAKDIITANDCPKRRFSEDSFECMYCNYRLQCWYPEETILAEERQFCGNCHYIGWGRYDAKSWCRHPEHPYPITIWGIKCPDWTDMFEKRKPERKRLSFEELSETQRNLSPSSPNTASPGEPA